MKEARPHIVGEVDGRGKQESAIGGLYPGNRDGGDSREKITARQHRRASRELRMATVTQSLPGMQRPQVHARGICARTLRGDRLAHALIRGTEPEKSVELARVALGRLQVAPDRVGIVSGLVATCALELDMSAR